MPLTIRRHLGVIVSTVFATMIAAAPTTHAQVLYGSIVGTVTDSTGATLPGATVAIEQLETTLTRELVSDAATITSPRCRPAPRRSW